MSDSVELERAIRRCADPAVTAALALLDRGAALNELVVVVSDAGQGLHMTVGTALEVFADAPELILLLWLERHRFPVGCLPWVAIVGGRIAWGAFGIAPVPKAEA